MDLDGREVSHISSDNSGPIFAGTELEVDSQEAS
jgi:hypothetical protein